MPHKGCPNECSFCNQKSISGTACELTVDEIEKTLKTAIKTAPSSDGEIAFFGGSFTAIDRAYMIKLLEKAKEYVDKGFFKGIRISTRPDAIDDEICTLLKAYKVTSVELGCQSMDDEVLLKNGRGHTSQDVVLAVKTLRKHGFEIGLQMMTGLYFSSIEKDLKTAQKIIDLKPNTVRIYPTVVLRNTHLAKLYKEKVYQPPTLTQTVSLCAKLLMMFHHANIDVIRLGLHSGGNVSEDFLAGAYHPALKDLCEGEIYFSLACDEIRKQKHEIKNIIIEVNSKYISAMIGQKKCNILKFSELGYSLTVKGNDCLKKYEVKIRR